MRIVGTQCEVSKVPQVLNDEYRYARVDALTKYVPSGTTENSPAIHRWVLGGAVAASPVGTIERIAEVSAVPAGLARVGRHFPAVNCWAIFVASLRDVKKCLKTALHTAARPAMCSLLVLALFVANASASKAAADPIRGESPPNIIFILADDLGYGDLGCYGQKQVKTPNLDRLAADGLRFTNAYAGGTVCAPSRCVLMTGLHAGHARVRGNGDATKPGLALEAGNVTVAEVIKDAGYTNGIIGKWGLGEHTNNTAGLPRNQGFDHFFGYLKHGHAHNYYPSFLWRNETRVHLPNVLSKDPAHKGNVAVKKVAYSHDLCAAEALEFVRTHREKPFFLYLAFTIPHVNNEAGDQGMEVPDYGEYADRDWPESQKGHAAMISRMDGDIGRLLALVEELNLAGNTLVVFASDNGSQTVGGFDADFYNSSGPLRGYKGNLTEGGIRVPLIARWPGHVPAGQTTDSPVYFADVMPTLAALCGGKAPERIDGVDFSPTLLGSQQPELADRFFYWEWNKNGLRSQAARWRSWKAIRNPQTGSLELYDLAADIGETRDLAKKHPNVAAKFAEYFRTARTDSPHWPVKLAAGRANKNAAANQ
jgi:arylsulfatase A-like enzyme